LVSEKELLQNHIRFIYFPGKGIKKAPQRDALKK
jgi:hypothetical protein